MFSGIIIAEEVDGVGDKGSGDITMVGVQTFWEVFLNMSQKFSYSIDGNFFLVKAKLLVLGLLSSNARLSGFPDY